MAKKPDFKTARPTGYDETQVVAMTDEQLAEKGVSFQGFGMKPGTYVQIPAAAERVTYKKAMRPGAPVNIPVVLCAEVVKSNDKFSYTGNVVEIGISSLFQLDADGKAHENDGVAQSTAHLANHKVRLDEIAEKVIAGGQEVIIRIPRTENSTDAKGNLHVNRIYNDEGKLMVREKKIVPSTIVENPTWA